MGPTGTTKAIQIHPTRRCNLRCRHCYSSSSPEATDTLAAETLLPAIDGLAAEGYNWASLSGGEPMVYKALPEVLTHVKMAGMQTAVVSNGMLLTPGRLDAIEAVTDLLVISLDGRPASHNRIRNHAKAFDTMAAKLPQLRERQINFGFLFTLTQYNLDELPWVVEFAANMGAGLLQIHPLEAVGNANRQMTDQMPDGIEGAHAWLLAQKFSEMLDDQMALQVDLVHSDALSQQPESFFLGDWRAALEQPLGEQLTPLVIEADGEVVPLQYGFSRDYTLGNLRRDDIRDLKRRWRAGVARRLHRLSREMLEEVNTATPGFFNWYERIAVQAEQRQPSPHLVPLSQLAATAHA